VHQGQNGSTVGAYNLETLFRAATPNANSAPTDARAGISQSDAQKRLDDVVAQLNVAQTKARQAAGAARTAAAATCTALAMLIGAFIGCVASALGGRERDEHA
jgi:hypothetical protein